jgi:hypothetical protein
MICCCTYCNGWFATQSAGHAVCALTLAIQLFFDTGLAGCHVPQAYLSKAGEEVVKGGHLNSVLGVFQRLIASKVCKRPCCICGSIAHLLAATGQQPS